MRKGRVAIVASAFIAANVTANILATYLGPWQTVVNAFLLIGLVIVARDVLHEELGLWGTAVVILVAGAISFVLVPASYDIARASLIAFLASEATDAGVYEYLSRRDYPWATKSNVSNTWAAIVDSWVFPTLAFGGVILWLTFAHIVAKILGGFLWSRAVERWAGEPARI